MNLECGGDMVEQMHWEREAECELDVRVENSTCHVGDHFKLQTRDDRIQLIQYQM